MATEAVPASEDEGSRALGYEEYAGVVDSEHPIPVLFGAPLMRLVKMTLGTLFFAILFHQPCWLSGAFHQMHVMVMNGAGMNDQPGTASVFDARMEVTSADLEVVDFQVRRLDASSANGATLGMIRSQMKRSQIQPSEASGGVSVDSAGRTYLEVPSLEEVDPAHLVRSEHRRIAVAASRSSPDVVVTVSNSVMASDQRSKFVSAMLSAENVIVHAVIAVMVLVGVMVHLRSQVYGLIQNLPELAVLMRFKPDDEE